MTSPCTMATPRSPCYAQAVVSPCPSLVASTGFGPLTARSAAPSPNHRRAPSHWSSVWLSKATLVLAPYHRSSLPALVTAGFGPCASGSALPTRGHRSVAARRVHWCLWGRRPRRRSRLSAFTGVGALPGCVITRGHRGTVCPLPSCSKAYDTGF
jgi:hypothetical protein